MQKIFRLFLFLLALSVIPALCQASKIILTRASPNHTVMSGSDERVYGTSASNQITLESDARAELIKFPSQNNIQIQSGSDLFTVSRSGRTYHQWPENYCDFIGMSGENFTKHVVLGVPTLFLLDRVGYVSKKTAFVNDIV